MAKQLHGRFSTKEVKMLLQKYLEDKKKLTHILEILKIKRRRFFRLLKEYEKDLDRFSIKYKRKRPTRKISQEVEKNIIDELKIAKGLIEDKELPILSEMCTMKNDFIHHWAIAHRMSLKRCLLWNRIQCHPTRLS